MFCGEGGTLWSVIYTHVTGRWIIDVMVGKQAYAGMYICICRYEELQPAGDAVRRRTAAASSVDGVDSGDRGFEVDVIFAHPVLGFEGWARGLGGPRRYSNSKPRVSVNVRTPFQPREACRWMLA